jgi:hypothetical protein
MIGNSIGRRRAHAEIKLLLDYSKRLYSEYVESNKMFIYASVLRKVNARLYERLSDNVAHLKDESHEDALELMLHLDVWMTIWDYEYEVHKPQLWDAFTFDNNINFPKASVENLLLDLAAFSE